MSKKLSYEDGDEVFHRKPKKKYTRLSTPEELNAFIEKQDPEKEFARLTAGVNPFQTYWYCFGADPEGTKLIAGPYFTESEMLTVNSDLDPMIPFELKTRDPNRAGREIKEKLHSEHGFTFGSVLRRMKRRKK